MEKDNAIIMDSPVDIRLGSFRVEIQFFIRLYRICRRGSDIRYESNWKYRWENPVFQIIGQKQTQSTVIDFKRHRLRYTPNKNHPKHHTSTVHQDKLILGKMGWALGSEWHCWYTRHVLKHQQTRPIPKKKRANYILLKIIGTTDCVVCCWPERTSEIEGENLCNSHINQN